MGPSSDLASVAQRSLGGDQQRDAPDARAGARVDAAGESSQQLPLHVRGAARRLFDTDVRSGEPMRIRLGVLALAVASAIALAGPSAARAAGSLPSTSGGQSAAS